MALTTRTMNGVWSEWIQQITYQLALKTTQKPNIHNGSFRQITSYCTDKNNGVWNERRKERGTPARIWKKINTQKSLKKCSLFLLNNTKQLAKLSIGGLKMRVNLTTCKLFCIVEWKEEFCLTFFEFGSEVTDEINNVSNWTKNNTSLKSIN